MGDGDPVCRPRRRPQKSHLRARATAARAIECQRPSGRPPHGGRDDSTSTGAVHPRYPLHGRGGGRRARGALDGPRALCRRYLGGLVPRALCEYMRPSTVAPWVSYTVPARLLNEPALTPHSSSTITRSALLLLLFSRLCRPLLTHTSRLGHLGPLLLGPYWDGRLAKQIGKGTTTTRSRSGERSVRRLWLIAVSAASTYTGSRTTYFLCFAALA